MTPSKVLIALAASAALVSASRPPYCGSHWGGWSGCTANCGGGSKSMTLYNCYGQYLGATSAACNAHPCPINCALAGWGGYGACSASCNGGKQQRHRGINTNANYGGQACPAPSSSSRLQEQVCNVHSCPVDCSVGDWEAWKPCDKECGTGTQERVRAIIQGNVGSGAACPTLGETKECNTQNCPVDCQMSEWAAGECDTQCGGGELVSTRHIDTAPAYGGAQCLDVSKTQPCNTQPCPVDCKLAALSPWSVCTKACEGGTKSAHMAVAAEPMHGGAACPPESIRNFHTECNTGPCPVDCVLAETFGDWSECSHECGGGIRQRTKDVISEANEVGQCENEGETESCNPQACPIDCVVTDMPEEFGMCTKQCGGGTQSRHRTIVIEAAHDGEACPTEGLRQEQACNTQECIETFLQADVDAIIATEKAEAAADLAEVEAAHAAAAKQAAAQLAIMKAYQEGANERYAKAGFEAVEGEDMDKAVAIEEGAATVKHEFDEETLAKIAEAKAAGHADATEGTRIPLRTFTGNCDDYCYCRVDIDGEKNVQMLPKSELNGEGCTTFSAGVETADGKKAEANFECYENEDKEGNLACDMMKEGSKKATDKFAFVWRQVAKKLAAKKSKGSKKASKKDVKASKKAVKKLFL